MMIIFDSAFLKFQYHCYLSKLLLPLGYYKIQLMNLFLWQLINLKFAQVNSHIFLEWYELRVRKHWSPICIFYKIAVIPY